MPDKGWKQFERRIASLFGGKRRGAYTGYENGGKTDVIVDGWAIECKLMGRIGYQDILDACQQAERNRDDSTDIPIAIVKRKGLHDRNAIVAMRLEEFEKWFV